MWVGDDLADDVAVEYASKRDVFAYFLRNADPASADFALSSKLLMDAVTQVGSFMPL